MTYQNQITEKEALKYVLVKYVSLDDEQRAAARHRTKELSVWQGTRPHIRKFNADLLSEMIRLEVEMKLAKPMESIQDTPVPTFGDMTKMFAPLAYAMLCIGALAWLGSAIVYFIRGTATQIQLLGQSWGGYIAMAGFGVLLFSFLPRITWSTKEGGTLEEFEQETFYQRTKYKKTEG